MTPVNVIGLGYIGLPTALIMASVGIPVVGTDYNLDVVSSLADGRLTFQEDGLEELFQAANLRGISYSSQYIRTDIYVVAVPTPYEKANKKIDPRYVIAAVQEILAVCPDSAVIVIESTVAPGTIDRFIRPLVEQAVLEGRRIDLVHAPERILPGSMIYELSHNPRTIGADDPQVAQRIRELYASFCSAEIVLTDIRTAEMTKVVENTYRDINIAFANELAKICRSDGMDVYEIIRIANLHPRVNILQPGPGVGGHCISVDPWFLVGDYPGLANIVLAARKINDSMPEFVLERIHDIMKEHGVKDVSRVGLYGLTYKEDVDDIRESPTLQVLESMAKHLATGIKVYDPFISVPIVKNQYFDFDEFLDSVDILVVMVGHSQIKSCLDKIKGKIIIDTRHVIPLDGVYRL